MSASGYRPFESLKEQLKRPPRQHGDEAPGGRKSGGSDGEDGRLFDDAMADVREIKSFRNLPYRTPQRRATPKGRSGDEDALRHLRDIIAGRRSIPLRDTQEYIEWVNPAYGKEVLSMLHYGKISVQDTIDLHGYTVQEARQRVREFLRESFRGGRRCIKIIHGRGLRSAKGPVLKEALIRWFSSDLRKWIIAYATARDCDGGLGATYVLLKG